MARKALARDGQGGLGQGWPGMNRETLARDGQGGLGQGWPGRPLPGMARETIARDGQGRPLPGMAREALARDGQGGLGRLCLVNLGVRPALVPRQHAGLRVHPAHTSGLGEGETTVTCVSGIHQSLNIYQSDRKSVN